MSKDPDQRSALASSGRYAVITTAALGLSSGLNFVALFVWIRLLDPREFGVYSLVSATALLLNALMFEWLRIFALRTLYDGKSDIRVDRRQADSLFAVILGLLGLLIVAGVVAWAAGIPVGGVDRDWLPLILLFTISEMALGMVNVVSLVRQQAWQFFQSMVLRSALAIALGLLLVIGFDLGALGVIGAIVAAQSVTAALIIARDPAWRGLRIGRRSAADGAALRELWRLGSPLILSTALAYFATVADRFILNETMGPAAVGQYAAASDLLQKTLGFLMLAINMTAYPALIRAYEDKGAEAAAKGLEDLFVLQLGVGLPAIVAFIVLSPGLSSLLLGATFGDTGQRLLPWVAMAALLRLLVSFHLITVFQLTRKMRLMIVAPAVSLLVLIPLGMVGSRANGVLGMAQVSLAAHAASFLVCAVLARRIMTFRLLSADSIKVTLASGAMGLALLPFAHVREPALVLILCLAGAVVYGAAVLALRLERIKPAERRLLMRLQRRRS